MKKKDIKKLNDALMDAADVPDSVLDAAREELANNLPETASAPATEQKSYVGAKQNGNTVAVNRKIIAVCCACAACLVCLAVVLAALFWKEPSNMSDVSYSYNIADLEASEISSPAEYNEQNNTDYIFVTFAETETYAYSEDGEVVLFSQAFSYENERYKWYIAVEEYAEFDILLDFADTYDTEQIGGYTVYYGEAEGNYAKFYADGSAYYLTGGEGLTDILKLILE